VTPTLEVGELKAVTAAEGDILRLVLEGTADAVVEADLGELIGQVHGEALRAGVREVVVDLRKLEFMNSSCFKAFITWIVAMRRLPEAQHYRIRFLSNAGLHWQKRSLHAIGYFGGDLVAVESL
jgi:hypothetical protein